MTPPVSTTGRVPKRSESVPHTSEPTPMKIHERKAAAEMSARDQPIDWDMGWRKMLSEIIAPCPIEVARMPTLTMTQP